MRIAATDEHYLLDNKPLYVYADRYTNRKFYLSKKNITIEATSCGHKIVVAANSCNTVTLVLPTDSHRISVGDEWEFVNTNFPSKYYCKGPTHLINSPGSEIIYGPIVHITEDMEVKSCSVFGECLISFCKEAYEQYVEITGIPHNNEIIFYIDYSCNYKINLQRITSQKRQTSHNDLLDLTDMARAIYYGSEIVIDENKTSNTDEPRNIQSILDGSSIYSIITGSLAEQLNGINCSVSDYDLMLLHYDDVQNAKTILLNYGYTEEAGRLTNPDSGNIKIDLSYDNYKIMNSHKYCERELNGLRFLSVDGLMLLALLNCYEFHRTPYPYFYKKNDASLLRLTKFAYEHSLMCNSKVAKDIDNIESYRERCIEICNTISSVPLSFRDTRINEPFRVNCFENEVSTIFSVINLGPPDNCRIVTPCDIKHGEWMDITGKNKQCRIENYQDFRLLYIDDVILPGVLTCHKD